MSGMRRPYPIAALAIVCAALAVAVHDEGRTATAPRAPAWTPPTALSTSIPAGLAGPGTAFRLIAAAADDLQGARLLSATPWRATPEGRVRGTIAVRSDLSGAGVVVPIRRRVVTADGRTWLLVSRPGHPGARTGWVSLDRVRVVSLPYTVDVSLAHQRMTVRRHGRVWARWRVSTGRVGRPTPPGTYYVTERLPQPASATWLGPWVLALNGYTPHVQRRLGNQLALHGTSSPGLIGRRASNGCVRLPNARIRRLAALLPVGTPVRIR